MIEDIAARIEFISGAAGPEIGPAVLEAGLVAEFEPAAVVPIGHRRDRPELHAIRIIVGIPPRATGIPGKHRHATGQRLLIGDALTLVLAQEDHRARTRQRRPVVLLLVAAVTQL